MMGKGILGGRGGEIKEGENSTEDRSEEEESIV